MTRLTGRGEVRWIHSGQQEKILDFLLPDSFLALIPAPVAVFSRDGSLLGGSPPFLKIFPGEYHDAVKMEDNRSFPDLHPLFEPLLSQVPPGGVRSGNVSIPGSEGTSQWNYVIRSVQDGRTDPFFIVMLHDTTGENLKARSLTEANQKILHLVAINRHDIKNILTAIMTYLEISISDLPEGQESLYLQKCQTMCEAIHRQLSFTRDLETMGAGKGSKWESLLEMVLYATSGVDLSQYQVLVGVGETEIFTDPLLERILYTFIENTLRHATGFTEIRFFCEYRGVDLVIVYEDNGPGVTSEMKDRIFYKGVGNHTGLGLFLAKELLQISGLSLKECGTPGKGVRFEIGVPQGLFRESPGSEKMM